MPHRCAEAPFFFFSSRRRHTRYIGDWSSDVCSSDLQELLREYTAWVFTLTADSDQAPTFLGLEQELATLPGIYAPPTGCLLLAMQDGLPAGCIALKGDRKSVV